ncbi:MAG: hypothetical protein ACHQ53_04195 [Polyangiales bacterium]
MSARVTLVVGVVLAWALVSAAPGAAQRAKPSSDSQADNAPPAASAPDDDATSSEEEPAATTSESSEPPASAPEQTETPLAPPVSPMRVAPFVGFGFGTRAFVRPTAMSTGQRLPTVFFPAAEIGLGATLWPANRFSLGLLLRYQTSVGLRVEQRPPFALPYTISARAERGELSVAPIVRLDDGPTAPSLAFPIGLGIRTFWPAVHEPPFLGYSLLGPQLRVELIWPLVERVRLRFGPELQWIVAVDKALRDEGVSQMGAAAGGEGSLQVRLSPVFSLDLFYRESHAFASSTNTGPIFNDVERFLMLRLTGEL